MSRAALQRRWIVAVVTLCVLFFLYRDRLQLQQQRVPNFPLARPIFDAGEIKKNHVYKKALIVASVQAEDTDWVKQELPEIDSYVYVNDDPHANLTVPQNKGHEVMTYLTFLIDHYENLPEVMIFVHAHRDAYHNPWLLSKEMPEIVRALNPLRVVRHGYVNLHCGDGNNKCWAKVRPAEGMPYFENKRAWLELFPQYPPPQALVQMPAAQFALSRDRAVQIPKQQYERYRKWMIDTDIPDGVSGFVFEFLWQFIFRGDYVFCPRPYVCYCDGFGICMDEETYDIFDKAYITAEGLARQIEVLQSNENISDDDRVKLDRFQQTQWDLQEVMERMREEAIERGKDPKVREEAASFVN